MIKTKQQLIDDANDLARKHQFKKEVIETMLNNLDQKKTLTEEHLEAMSIIQNILNEMKEISDEHQEILKQIKG